MGTPATSLRGDDAAHASTRSLFGGMGELMVVRVRGEREGSAKREEGWQFTEQHG
jgi:hypothetical protein